MKKILYEAIIPAMSIGTPRYTLPLRINILNIAATIPAPKKSMKRPKERICVPHLMLSPFTYKSCLKFCSHIFSDNPFSILFTCRAVKESINF